MGVGAVFISTLAMHQLGPPADPPITQQDYLTLTIQPIVCSTVLSSIIVRKSNFHSVNQLSLMPTDGLSIPFFTFGRSLSRTVTLSKTLTSRTVQYLEWLSGVNRNPVLPTEHAADGVPSPPLGDGDFEARLQGNHASQKTIRIIVGEEHRSHERGTTPSPLTPLLLSTEVGNRAYMGSA